MLLKDFLKPQIAMSVTNHKIQNYAGPASRRVQGVTNNDIQNLAGLARQRGQSVTEPTFPSLPEIQNHAGLTKQSVPSVTNQKMYETQPIS